MRSRKSIWLKNTAGVLVMVTMVTMTFEKSKIQG